MSNASDRTHLSPLLRLFLRLGRPFGMIFVPHNHLQSVYHMGQYAGVRGPGVTFYNRLTEAQGPLVFTGGQVKDFKFTGLISKDVLPVNMALNAIIGYDPRLAPALAHVLIHRPPEFYPQIAEKFLRWAAQAAANVYNAAELTQKDVMRQVEKTIGEVAANEMEFLGVQLRGKVRVMQIDLPARLAERQETLAQRRANILAGAEFHPFEVRRALVTEVLENLGRAGAGESFVNFNELIEAYSADIKSGARRAPIIDNPPQSTLGKDDGARADSPGRNSDSVKTSPRPKSRL